LNEYRGALDSWELEDLDDNMRRLSFHQDICEHVTQNSYHNMGRFETNGMNLAFLHKISPIQVAYRGFETMNI
jgi:hypothetical protein